MSEYAFNDYATIESAAQSRDTDGAVILTWSTLRSVWCRVEDETVREYLQADEPQAKRMVKVRCYWDDISDVTAAMRVTFGSRTLRIEGVLKSALGDRGHLMCEEMTT